MVRKLDLSDPTNKKPSGNRARGTTLLPASRVKFIVKQDKTVSKLSNAATFSLSVATELFVAYLAKQSHRAMKSNRKKGKILYKDVAAAVSHIDNLEFLTDVIPRSAKLYIRKAPDEESDETEESEEPGEWEDEPTESKRHESVQQHDDDYKNTQQLPEATRVKGNRPTSVKSAGEPVTEGLSQPMLPKRPSTALDTSFADRQDDANTSPAKRRQSSSSKPTSPVDLRNLIHSTNVSPLPFIPKDVNVTKAFQGPSGPAGALAPTAEPTAATATAAAAGAGAGAGARARAATGTDMDGDIQMK